MPKMTDYEFTLRFRLPDPDADPRRLVAALARTGCDDAVLGLGQRGRIALAFTREARSALQAISSAIRAVRRAIPGAELVEASPDLVGLTDVAGLIGCSRQNMRNLAISNPASFPLALHEGTQSIWHLRPILDWFRATQGRPVDRALLDVSEVTMKVNIAKQSSRLLGDGLPKELEQLLA